MFNIVIHAFACGLGIECMSVAAIAQGGTKNYYNEKYETVLPVERYLGLAGRLSHEPDSPAERSGQYISSGCR